MSIQTLDYPNAKIQMNVTNDIEQQFRVMSAGKEPWTTAFIEAIPADGTFWDVGANVGGYTLIAASRNLRTIAIEPMYANVHALLQNLALNNFLDRVLVLPGGVGPMTGFDWFHFNDLRPGSAHHVVGGQRKLSFHRQLIQVWTLDNLAGKLALDSPSYLKIDTDGGELAVLAGAREFLRSPKLQGVMIELPDQIEKQAEVLMNEAGLVRIARHNERQGKSIGPISYGHFVRPSGG